MQAKSPKVGNYQVSKSGGLRWSMQSLVLTGETTAVARSDKDCVSVTDIEPLKL